MEIGNKILELRKKNNLSQEALAEKIGVTRQTISKWELGETAPDIKQAKELSKVFNVSLDELTDNDIKNVLEAKVSNTEKLAGIIIKILKVIGILSIIYVILFVIALILFTVFPNEQRTTTEIISADLNCSIGDNNYLITIGEDNYFECMECNKDMMIYLKDITDGVISFLNHVKKSATTENPLYKDGSVNLDLIKKVTVKTNIKNAAFLMGGLALSILGLAVIIPKTAFWITKKLTGKNEFSGTMEVDKKENN